MSILGGATSLALAHDDLHDAVEKWARLYNTRGFVLAKAHSRLELCRAWRNYSELLEKSVSNTMSDADRIALARALVPDGWVVVRDCEEAPHIPTGRDEHTPDYADGHADGWEQARAAMLASGEETP